MRGNLSKKFCRLMSLVMAFLMIITTFTFVTPKDAMALDVTLANNGYAYGEMMSTDEITLVTEVETGAFSSCQWYTSDSENGTYTAVEGGTSLKLTFTPEDGNWYKCTVNETVSTKPVRAVKVGSINSSGDYIIKAAKTFMLGQWYITNGTMAYTSVGMSDYTTNFDVIGKYVIGGTEHWINTSYGNGWQTYSSSDDVPEINSKSFSKLDKLRCSFDQDDTHSIYMEADLKDGEKAFAFGADVELASDIVAYDDAASLKAVYDNDTVSQIQMVSALTIDDAVNTDAAFVLKYIDAPSCYWIGNYYLRQTWGYNTDYIDSYIVGTREINSQIVATEISGDDSGMISSWTNVPSGGTVKFQFSVGAVSDTGALITATATTTATSVTITDADINNYYSLYDNLGNKICDWTNVVDSDGNIVFTGLNADTKYVIKVISSTDYDASAPSQDVDKIKEFNTTTAIDPIQNPTQTGEESSVGISSTADSITLTNLNNAYTYQLQDSEGIPVSSWTAPDSDNKIVFTGLDKNVQYYLVAQSSDNSISEKAPVNTKDKETTPSAFIDYDNMVISGLVSGEVYIVNNKEITADENGSIAISKDMMDNGVIVAKKGDGQNVLDSDQQNISSVGVKVEVTQGNGINTVIDNLDNIFSKDNRVEDDNKGITQSEIINLQNGGNITVNLVSNKNNATDDIGLTSIKNAIKNDGMENGVFIDIDILKKIYDNTGVMVSSTNLIELPMLIKITVDIPQELQGKDEYGVYRNHEGEVDLLKATPNEDEEYFEIEENKLNLYVKKFSTYVLTYKESANTGEEEPSTGEEEPSTGEEEPSTGEEEPSASEEESSTDADILSPTTGDNAQSGVWLFVFVLSIASVLAVCTAKYKKENVM